MIFGWLIELRHWSDGETCIAITSRYDVRRAASLMDWLRCRPRAIVAVDHNEASGDGRRDHHHRDHAYSALSDCCSGNFTTISHIRMTAPAHSKRIGLCDDCRTALVIFRYLDNTINNCISFTNFSAFELYTSRFIITQSVKMSTLMGKCQ